jgi:hypothetical protein
MQYTVFEDSREDHRGSQKNGEEEGKDRKKVFGGLLSFVIDIEKCLDIERYL